MTQGACFNVKTVSPDMGFHCKDKMLVRLYSECHKSNQFQPYFINDGYPVSASILSMKSMKLFDSLTVFTGHLYTGKTTSLYWDGPQESAVMVLSWLSQNIPNSVPEKCLIWVSHFRCLIITRSFLTQWISRRWSPSYVVSTSTITAVWRALPRICCLSSRIVSFIMQ